MNTLYDGNGNIISLTETSCNFNVKDYNIFESNNGTERQAILTYEGKSLYPQTYNDLIKEKIKKYEGGVMLTIGDSYTAMMNVDYFTPFAEKHGLIQDNRGLGSSTIAGNSEGTVGNHPFWIRLDEAITQYKADGGYKIGDTAYTCDDVKLITFMGGTNDWNTVNNQINRLGTGVNDTNKETIYGACNYIFRTLLNTFNNADIIVILQPVHWAYSIPTEEKEATDVGFKSLSEAQGMTDAQYSSYIVTRKEAIVKEVAEKYGLTICDCCFNWYSPINPSNAIKYWQSDKLHLTNEGWNEIIKKLEHTVNMI